MCVLCLFLLKFVLRANIHTDDIDQVFNLESHFSALNRRNFTILQRFCKATLFPVVEKLSDLVPSWPRCVIVSISHRFFRRISLLTDFQRFDLRSMPPAVSLPEATASLRTARASDDAEMTCIRPCTRLIMDKSRKASDVVVHRKCAIGRRALSVYSAFRNQFAIKVSKFFQEPDVQQQHRPACVGFMPNTKI